MPLNFYSNVLLNICTVYKKQSAECICSKHGLSPNFLQLSLYIEQMILSLSTGETIGLPGLTPRIPRTVTNNFEHTRFFSF